MRSREQDQLDTLNRERDQAENISKAVIMFRKHMEKELRRVDFWGWVWYRVCRWFK